jgi:hypothetical protein
MYKFLKDAMWIIYLGGVLIMINTTVFNWQWWVIIVPTVLLVVWKDY